MLKFQNRNELVIYISECITENKEYQLNIQNDLLTNYTDDRLINAACEYTPLFAHEISL